MLLFASAMFPFTVCYHSRQRHTLRYFAAIFRLLLRQLYAMRYALPCCWRHMARRSVAMLLAISPIAALLLLPRAHVLRHDGHLAYYMPLYDAVI